MIENVAFIVFFILLCSLNNEFLFKELFLMGTDLQPNIKSWLCLFLAMKPWPVPSAFRISVFVSAK